MASNATTIEMLLAKAADVHPRVVGQPTDDDIFKMEEILGPILHNAKYDMIIVAGTVNHNLIGLIQPIATYVATWTAAFVIPTRPTPYNLAIDDNATSVVRNRMEAAHNTLITDYEVFEAAEMGASAFIRTVVDETWYKALRHPITFYNNVTAFTILEYLRNNSGGLHSNDLTTLPSEMLHYYTDAEGISEFILALAKAREKLARGGLPMSDATVLAMAHSQVFASLHYPEATREWERLPSAQQTWTAWQTKYREANIERLHLQRANPSSFGNAHHVTDAQRNHTAITAALDNIANEATNDSTVMASILAKLAALDTRLNNMQAQPTPTTIVMPITPATTPFVPRKYTQAEARATFDPTGYCSTHGWRVHASHTSVTCKKKGRCHNDAAMQADTKGGSMKNKGWETNPDPM
jgi:hypothetical protein